MYAMRRILGTVVLLWAMTVLVFVVFFAAPADPARLSCGEGCDAAAIAANRVALGYDQPLVRQYLDFLGGLVHERTFPEDSPLQRARPDLVEHCAAPCLGYSPLARAQVLPYLTRRLPVTISLALGAYVLSATIGVALGLLAASRRGRWPDRAIVATSAVLSSLPVFFVGLVFYNILHIRLGFFPEPGYHPFADNPLAWAAGMALPCLVLAVIHSAVYVRTTRSHVLDALSEEYARYARAKGVSSRGVLIRHALRIALTPLVTLSAVDVGLLLGGAPVVEHIFHLDGMGAATVASAIAFDLPMIAGIVLVTGFFVIVANLVADVLYAVVDPRVRLGAGQA
jgi:peptide/nickel transport system permease protein